MAGAAQLQAGRGFYTWLYRIAHNVTYDWLRKKKIQGDGEFDDERTEHRAAAGAEAAPRGDAAPDTALRNAEVGQRIQAAIARLSPEHRQVIVLARWKGWPMRKSPRWSPVRWAR
jgi:RNA polymerase sigma-70 factor (ECF subfamily)